MQNLGKRLRALRDDRELTLAQLGQQVGLSASYLSQIERGVTMPSLSRLTTLAKALDVSPHKVENMIQVARRPLSLETPIDTEQDSVLGDFIEDDEVPAPDELATNNLLREHLDSVLNGLPPREVRILQLRYGLRGGRAYTLEEVGRKMGVTRERVRQIEAQALSRLGHHGDDLIPAFGSTQIDLHLGVSQPHEVAVAFDEAGNRQLASQVDDLGV